MPPFPWARALFAWLSIAARKAKRFTRHDQRLKQASYSSCLVSTISTTESDRAEMRGRTVTGRAQAGQQHLEFEQPSWGHSALATLYAGPVWYGCHNLAVLRMMGAWVDTVWRLLAGNGGHGLTPCLAPGAE